MQGKSLQSLHMLHLSAPFPPVRVVPNVPLHNVLRVNDDLTENKKKNWKEFCWLASYISIEQTLSKLPWRARAPFISKKDEHPPVEPLFSYFSIVAPRPLGLRPLFIQLIREDGR